MCVCVCVCVCFSIMSFGRKLGINDVMAIFNTNKDLLICNANNIQQKPIHGTILYRKNIHLNM